MDRRTFALIVTAAEHAEMFLKLDPECWLNKPIEPIRVIVATKGHPARPELPNRPTLAAQAVFGLFHRSSFQDGRPFSEHSLEFRNLAASWGGGIFIAKSVNPSLVGSHRPRKQLAPKELFSVGASGGKPKANSKAEKAFVRAMNIFLDEFERENPSEFDEETVRGFAEKVKGRITQPMDVPSVETLMALEGKEIPI